jgi:2-keto-4-pentenoate hydratase/2-oxohepta-3-ene-1,7-dioic acid hydratase in catechol pathway
MRFAHAVLSVSAAPVLVHVTDDGVVPVPELVPAGPATLEQLIAGGSAARAAVEQAASAYAGPRTPLADISFAPAVLAPPSIMAVGLNYAAHAGELSLKSDDTPTVFTLWPNSLAPHEGTTTTRRSSA